MNTTQSPYSNSNAPSSPDILKKKIFTTMLSQVKKENSNEDIVNPMSISKDNVQSISPQKKSQNQPKDLLRESVKYTIDPSFLNISPPRKNLLTKALEVSPNMSRPGSHRTDNQENSTISPFTVSVVKQNDPFTLSVVKQNDPMMLSIPQAKLKSPEKEKFSIFVNGKPQQNMEQSNERVTTKSPLFLDKDFNQGAKLYKKENIDITNFEMKSNNWQQRLLDKGQRTLELLQNEYNVLKECRELHQKFRENSKLQKLEIQEQLNTLFENQNVVNLKEIQQYLFPNITNLTKKITSYIALAEQIQAQAQAFKQETINAIHDQQNQIVDIDSTLITLMGVVGREQENIIKLLDDFKIYLKQKPNSHEAEECAHSLLLILRNSTQVYQNTWDKITQIYIVLGELLEHDASIISQDALTFKYQIDRFNDSKYELTESIDLSKRIKVIETEMEKLSNNLMNFFTVTENKGYIVLIKPENWKEALKQYRLTTIDRKQQLKDVKSSVKKLGDPTISKTIYFQKVRFTLREQLEEALKKGETKCEINKVITEILEDMTNIEKELRNLYMQERPKEEILKDKPPTKENITKICAELNEFQGNYGALRRRIWYYQQNQQYKQILGDMFQIFIDNLDIHIKNLYDESEKLLKQIFKDDDITKKIEEEDIDEYIDVFKKFILQKLLPDPAIDYTQSEKLEEIRKDLDSKGRKKKNILEQLLLKSRDEKTKSNIRYYTKSIEEILNTLKIIEDIFEAGIKINDLNKQLIEYAENMDSQEVKRNIDDTIDILGQYNKSIENYQIQLALTYQQQKPNNLTTKISRMNSNVLNQSPLPGEKNNQTMTNASQSMAIVYQTIYAPSEKQSPTRLNQQQQQEQFQQQLQIQQQQQKQGSQSPLKKSQTIINNNNTQSILNYTSIIGQLFSQQRENTLLTVCNLSIYENERFINIYKRILLFFYKDIKELSKIDQAKYQKLLADKYNRFCDDIYIHIKNIATQNNTQRYIIECINKWTIYINTINQSHDLADREDKLITKYRQFVEKYLKREIKLYNIESYQEILTYIPQNILIKGYNYKLLKNNEAKNAYEDLIYMQKIMEPFANQSLEKIIIYNNFCDPVCSTVSFKGILDIMNNILEIINIEKETRLENSSYSEILITWSDHIENIIKSMLRLCQYMEVIKGNFTQNVNKGGFKDVAEFYANFVSMYKLLVTLQIENDPAFLKFPYLKRKFSLLGYFQQKYNLNMSHIEILDNFVKVYKDHEYYRTELFWELDKLLKNGRTLIGSGSFDDRMKLKKLIQNYAALVEGISGLYGDSQNIMVIHQYKSLNPGIKSLDMAFEQVLNASEKLISALKVIINTNNESSVEVTMQKLENSLGNIDPGEDYMQILSVLKILTTKRASIGAGMRQNFSRRQIMEYNKLMLIKNTKNKGLLSNQLLTNFELHRYNYIKL